MTYDINEIIKWAGGAVVVLASIVQISPIKINPWSAIARGIGNALVGEQISKLDKRMDKIEDTLKEQQSAFAASVDEAGRDRAETRRYRILKFGDECTHGQPHTAEMWNNVLDDITEYERYCTEHPEFKNQKTVLTDKLIKDAYHEALKNKCVL